MSAPTDTYLLDATYHALKDELARLVAENFDKHGTDPGTEVVMALGEIGGIWPESVKNDAAAS